MINNFDIPEVKSFVEKTINSVNGFEIEYFEIVDDIELIPVKSKAEMKQEKQYFGCIALKAGKIRLIDNIKIGLV
jgi:pantoate--beta-alanine ligase